MLRVLVVDDEVLVRESVIYLLEKSGVEALVVGQAANGKDALEKIEELGPDLVVMDIRMPVIDGLALMKEIKLCQFDTKFIVISGFADFNYAQEALKWGASDYLLKPIQDEQFISAIWKVCTCINNEQERARKIMTYDHILRENQYLSIDNMLNRIILSGIPVQKTLDRFLDNYKSLKEQYYCIAVFLLSSGSFADFDEIKFNIVNIIEKSFLGEDNCYICQNHRNSAELIFLACGDNILQVMGLVNARLNQCKEMISCYIPVPVTIGVSSYTNKFEQVGILYENARAALKKRFISGMGKIYYYSTNIDMEGEEPLLSSMINLAANVFTMYETEKIVGRLEKILIDIFSTSNVERLSSKSIKLLFAEIVNYISIYAKKNNINAADFIENDAMSGDTVDRLDSCSQIVEYLLRLAESIIDANKTYAVDVKSMIMDIKAYIDQNYYDRITLSIIADKFGVNPNYLSGVFRDEMGVNFIDYLTLIRMEKAKKLLGETNLSISQVSENVGYNYQAYFQKVFKRAAGITPLEYRQSCSSEMKKV